MIKQILFLLLFIPFLATNILINHLFLLLDNLFFPRFRKTDISSPLFITGLMRSGTTLLYDTLYADRKRFTAMKLWEILFAPSIIQKKTFRYLGKIDNRTGKVLHRMIKATEKKVFSPIQSLHPVSLFNNEEDELLLLHILSTTFLIFLFPRSKFFRSLTDFDHSIPLTKRERIIAFYKNCIKRHMYAFGKGKTYLAKCSSHTSKILSLKTHFPGCNIVFIYREPYAAIRSSAGFLQHLAGIFHTAVTRYQIEKDIIQVGKTWYGYIKLGNEHPSGGETVVVDFEEFVHHLKAVTILLYHKLNFQVSDSYSRILDEKQDKSSHHKGEYPELKIPRQELESEFSEIVKYIQSVRLKI
jgi:hypothetical protein